MAGLALNAVRLSQILETDMADNILPWYVIWVKLRGEPETLYKNPDGSIFKTHNVHELTIRLHQARTLFPNVEYVPTRCIEMTRSMLKVS